MIESVLWFITKHFICILVLVLDAMDTSGEQHLQIEHNIYKRKLDLEGKPIEDPQKGEVGGGPTTQISQVIIYSYIILSFIVNFNDILN